ncbi:polymer-forming cytoskeletal protein [Metabacillus idriensis]|uniref:polymer-forming cytoskeletal protein n=1 Tax=Metabacillus idriensis TaxID=324768 RepID=UPI003D2C81F6
MEQMTKLHDLKINGSGSAGGGHFKTVSISGSGKIAGDIECESMKIGGSGKVEGSIFAETIKISGSSTLKGKIETKLLNINGSTKLEERISAVELTVNGSAKMMKDVKAGELKVNGSAKISGKLHADRIDVSGMLTAAGDCEAETFRSSGVIHVGGLLSADNIHICLDHYSKVKEIGGETITVSIEKSFNLFRRMFRFLNSDPHLHTEVIEGDTVRLQHTKAKLVRGTDIYIGENCEIGTVEYSGSLDIHPKASVHDSVKV